MLTPEEQDELQRLMHAHIPIRAIARRLNRDVKTIRRALGRAPNLPAPAPSKLASPRGGPRATRSTAPIPSCA